MRTEQIYLVLKNLGDESCIRVPIGYAAGNEEDVKAFYGNEDVVLRAVTLTYM